MPREEGNGNAVKGCRASLCVCKQARDAIGKTKDSARCVSLSYPLLAERDQH